MATTSHITRRAALRAFSASTFTAAVVGSTAALALPAPESPDVERIAVAA